MWTFDSTLWIFYLVGENRAIWTSFVSARNKKVSCVSSVLYQIKCINTESLIVDERVCVAFSRQWILAISWENACCLFPLTFSALSWFYLYFVPHKVGFKRKDVHVNYPFSPIQSVTAALREWGMRDRTRHGMRCVPHQRGVTECLYFCGESSNDIYSLHTSPYRIAETSWVCVGQTVANASSMQ